VVPVGEKRDAYKLRSVHLTETDHMSHLGTDGKVIAKCIIKNGFKWCGINSFGSQ